MNKPIFSVEVARQNIEKSYQDNREVIISYINSQIENASKITIEGKFDDTERDIIIGE
jgi:hypothetical protein